MKNYTLTFFLVIFTTIGFSQVPEAFNYQAVIRNSSGEIISNSPVSFRISILQNSDNGNVAYSETQQATTTNFGLVNLKIGEGNRISGSFDPANWGSSSHFLKIEIDLDGGSNYSLLGTTQLLAVPYAFHAKTVENDQVNDADSDPTNEIQTLNISGTQLTLSNGGGTVTLPSSGGGDNWGTQTVVSDATLDGNGTSANPLSVVGDLTDDQTLSISGNELSISDGNTVNLPAGSESLWTSSGADIYYNKSGGKVGIGTDSPVEKLDVNGNVNVSRLYGYKITGSGTNALFGAEGLDLRLLNYAGGGNIKFYTTPYGTTSPLTRMYISDEGNIGIGSITPQQKLQLAGGNMLIENNYGIRLFNTTNLSDVDNYSELKTSGQHLHLVNHSTGGIYFGVSPSGTQSFRLIIDDSGRIGIGTVNPAAGLHLLGTGFPNSFMYIQSNSGQDAGIRIYEGTTAKWHIFNNSNAGGLQIYNSAAKTAIFAKQSNSYVGIGTTNPTQALHVVGNAYKTEGGTSWATSSDLRLKNINGKYKKGLTEICKLNAVKYHYKKDNPRQLNPEIEQVGFVAQEVQKIFPEAISTGDDGFLDFNIHPINIALINSIKELNTENQQLKNKVKELEKRMQEIESFLKATAKN